VLIHFIGDHPHVELLRQRRDLQQFLARKHAAAGIRTVWSTNAFSPLANAARNSAGSKR